MESLEGFRSSIQFCSPLLSLAKERDVASEDLFEGTGITPGNLQDTTHMLSNQQQRLFISNVLRAFGDAGIGLDAGLRANYRDLGVLGLAMLSSPNFRHALQIGSKYARAVGLLTELDMVETSNRLGHKICFSDMPLDLKRYVTEETFSAVLRYSETLLGENKPQPLKVAEYLTFNYAAPPYVEKYYEIFDCPLTFDAEETVFWYNEKLLDLTLPMSNHLASAMCESLCQKLLDDLREDDQVIKAVRSIISQNLDNTPSLDEVSRKLAMSPRTLRRKLQEQGRSYSGLVNAIKSSFAKDLLKNPSLTIVGVSEFLGYSELGNFRRAFRAWTGLSPYEFRQKTLLSRS